MSGGPTAGGGRFPPRLLYAASVLYYLEDATQAQIAAKLETSRATVSRLLSEARRQGIVHIEVVPPAEPQDGDLGDRLVTALGLQDVHLYPDTAAEVLGAAMGPALSAALVSAQLAAGDVVLVSSGRMLYAAAHAELPSLPGVLVAPTVGGQLEPEPWYQTNEITRAFAATVGGHPSFLHAPALPGAALRETLLDDPAIGRVLGMWQRARCAVLGLGGPVATRRSLPRFVPSGTAHLAGAVGDVCSRFFDHQGREVAFPGSERLLAIGLDRLREVEVTIAVAEGAEKVGGILAGARAGFFNRLVTSSSTAALLLEAAGA